MMIHALDNGDIDKTTNTDGWEKFLFWHLSFFLLVKDIRFCSGCGKIEHYFPNLKIEFFYFEFEAKLKFKKITDRSTFRSVIIANVFANLKNSMKLSI